MKKHILIILSLVAGMAACSRPELENAASFEKDNVIVAELESRSNVETKTTLQYIDNGVYRSAWSENDRVSVWNEDGTKGLLELKSGAGTGRGVFEGIVPEGKYIAYYPFDASAAYYPDDNLFIAEVLPVQYYKEGTYDDGAYPMIAVADGPSISFRNLFSVLKISLKGTQMVRSIDFVSASEDCQVSGLAYIGTEWTSAPEMSLSSGGPVMTLVCGEGVLLNQETPTDFYMVLPPQTYKGGFTLKITTDAGDYFKSTDKDVVLTRSQLRAIPPFDLEEDKEVEWKRVYGPYGEEYGVFRDDIVAGAFNVQGFHENHMVEVYERADLPGYYRFDNIYTPELLSMMFSGGAEPADSYSSYVAETQFIVDAVIPTKVFVPFQPIGLNLNDDYGWLETGSLAPENGFESYSEYGMISDGVISFPVNGLFMYLPGDGSYYYANQSGMTQFILPGMDLGFDCYVGEAVDGRLEIALDKGKDLASVKVAVFDGDLSYEQVIACGSDIAFGQCASSEMTENGVFVVSGKTTGRYTAVFVAFDNGGNVVHVKGYPFGYVAAGDDKAVVIGFERIFKDEWAAEGYSPENMIGVNVKGNGITWFHTILYSMSVLEQNSEEVIKNSMMTYPTYGGEEGLALVNSTGVEMGWIGLEPGTDYCLAICASNGYYTELFLYVVTTEGDVMPLRKQYGMEDIVTADKADYCGVWDFYAAEYASGSSDRRFMGDVTVADGGMQMDSLGGTEIDCFEVSGLLAPAVGEGYVESDKLMWEYYEGYILPLHRPVGTMTSGDIQYDLVIMGLVGDSIGYTDSAIVGGFTSDGNIAFVDTGLYSDYGPYNGYLLCAFNDGSYAGYLFGYCDMMFLPGETRSAAVASKAMAARPDMVAIGRNLKSGFNLVEPMRVQIHDAIDKMKQEAGMLKPCGQPIR